MEYNDNNFKNVINNTKSRNNDSFKKNIAVPFLSGIVGCSLVLATCFGVPSIKEKLIGKDQIVNNSSSNSKANDDTVGIVDQVSLSNYSDTAIYASSKVLPSIVGISVTYSVKSNIPSFYGMFGGQSTTSEAQASGSGIIISEDGYIVTNNHVVASSSNNTYYEISEATNVKVTLFGDDTQYDATIVGKDAQTDLAVLKIDKTGLTAAEFADSDSVKVGEFAMAVGNPLDLGTSITCGIVSALNRTVSDDDGTTYKCIQTDAAINSGNSGGALVNSDGEVIGINTLKVSSTGVEGIGFAIPINSTTDIINQLITYNKVKRPYIGISGRDLDEETAKRYDMVVGIYVVSVEEYSAAEKAGLKPGDVITQIDGKAVTKMDELNEIKNTHSIGDTVTLKINRDGHEKDISLTLGEQNAD